ncbi:MAG: IS1380 family transposase, partial [Chloroflexota bacterium]|nr:IS1380 family transposase [Chloroflexota bacterium]
GFDFYHSCYCYMPLYVFCRDHLLLARLRSADSDPGAGVAGELGPLIERIRSRWPDTQIVLRADSGFAREETMAFCEREGIGYVFGLARNPRLQGMLSRALRKSRRRHLATGKPARRYRQLSYRTLKTWSRSRRVVGKAEHLAKGSNPRFVVSSLPPARIGKQDLYEKLYCPRGDMENRIKEMQLSLFSDRTSAATIAANQLRLYFSGFAYVLLEGLRRLGLQGTGNGRLQAGSLRLRFLKVAGRIRITHRRIWISLPGAHPFRPVFAGIVNRLAGIPVYDPSPG